MRDESPAPHPRPSQCGRDRQVNRSHSAACGRTELARQAREGRSPIPGGLPASWSQPLLSDSLEESHPSLWGFQDCGGSALVFAVALVGVGALGPPSSSPAACQAKPWQQQLLWKLQEGLERMDSPERALPMRRCGPSLKLFLQRPPCEQMCPPSPGLLMTEGSGEPQRV